MEAATVGALVSSTLPTLLSVIREKCKKKKEELEHDVRSIQIEFEFMQTKLKDPRWRGERTSDLRRAWIAQLRRLADDIEDCMDSFQVNCIRASNFAKEIVALKKRSKDISELLQRYMDKEPSNEEVPPNSFCSMLCFLNLFFGWAFPSRTGVAVASSHRRRAPPMVEAEEDLLSLVQNQSETKVISVIGFGGQNTDLARRVYENDQVRRQFSQRALVSAVDKTMSDVLSEILRQVGNEPRPARLDKLILSWVLSILPFFHRLLLKVFRTERSSTTQQSGSDVVEHQLKSRLSNKRYLVLIQDVEREEVYNRICALAWANRRGCRIIVTTAIRSAVRPCICGNDLPLHVPDSSSTALVLVGEVGGKRYDETCFALCAAAVARTQRLLASEDYERVVLEDCLLYFSMFPVHHHVRRNPLIRRWLAEGLMVHAIQQVPENVYRFAQDVAAMHLDTLIDRNIIESVKKSNNGKVKRCKPPGVVFNHICGKAVVQNIFTLCGQNQIAQQQHIRRLSLHPHTAVANGGLNVPDPDVPCCLRTMVVFPTAGSQYGDILSFDKHMLLRVLDLKECADVNEVHLLTICKLLLLKYLSLGNNIERVPRKISRLKRLETLEMRTTAVVTVYSELLELPKLKHLLGKFRLSSVDSPKGKVSKLKDSLCKKSALETLDGIVVGNGKGIPQLLSHLLRLRKVKIWCDSTTDESTDLTDLKEGIKSFTSRGNRTPNVDYSLSIDFKGSSQSFLDSLEDPGTLTSFKLSGNLTRFRPVAAQLYSLQELCLSMTNLTGAAIQSGLSNLKCELKFLKLVEDNLGGLEIREEKPFASLERICFVGTHSIAEIKLQDLSKLLSLHLLCPTLGGLPHIQIGSLRNLKEIGLHPIVDGETKRGWEDAAMNHRLKPKVVSVEVP